MKNTRFTTFCLLGALLAWSCDKEPITPDPEPEPDAPTIELSQTEISAPVEGGEYIIDYTVTNPVEDASVEFTEVPEWIAADASADNAIKVTISGNDASSSREGVIKGKYESAEFQISVVQEGNPAFEMEFYDIQESSLKFKVTPLDEKMTYLCIHSEAFKMEGVDDETYLDGVISTLDATAKQHGMTLKSYISSLLHSGVQEDLSIEKLVPGIDYVVSCAGYDNNEECFITPLNRFDVKTKEIERIDVTFELSADVRGPVADLKAIPSDAEQNYMSGSAMGAGSANPEEILVAYQKEVYTLIETVAFYYPELSRAEIVTGLSYKGEQTIGFELATNQDYNLFVVCVDDYGYLNTMPQLCHITTGAVEPSDNVITVDVVEVYDYTAKAEVHTTNDDPYIVGYTAAKYFQPGMTDEEIIADLFSGRFTLPTNTRRGDSSLEMMGLDPNSEWFVFSYGYESDEVTTEVKLTRFNTTDIIYGDVSLTLEFDKYYDGDALLAEYPDEFSGMDIAGKAVIPVTAETTGDVGVYYYKIVGYDASVLEDRTINLTLKSESYSSPHAYLVAEYDKVHSILGNAFDKEGWPGKLFRAQGLTFTKDGVSPVSEFTPFPGPAAVMSAPEKKMPIDKTTESLMATLRQ